MKRPILSSLLAALLLAPTAGLASCSIPAPTTALASGTGRISLQAEVGDRVRGTLNVISPYTQADIDHVVLKLFSVVSGVETPVLGPDSTQVTVDIPSTVLGRPVVFSSLANDTTYRVRAFAYQTAGESASDLISDESTSFVDVTVGSDSAPQMASVPVLLIDKAFEAEATSAMSVTTGGLAGVGFESIESAGFLPLQGNVTTFAGSGTQGYQDGEATAAAFRNPQGVVAGPDGTLYVADSQNFGIRMVSPQGVVSTLYRGASYSTSLVKSPMGLAFDLDGGLLVADNGTKTIKKVDSFGNVTTLAGTGLTGSNDGPASEATFEYLRDLTVAPDGSIYIADQYKLRKLSTDGQVSTVAGDGVNSSASPPVDGQGSDAKFSDVRGIEVGPDGNIYVPAYSGYLRIVTPTGTVTTKRLRLWSNYLTLSRVAFDSAGDLYVALQNTVVKVTQNDTSSTWDCTLLAGYPSSYGSVDGFGGQASFTPISGMTFDQYDNLFVAEIPYGVNGNRIRRIR